MSNIFSTARIKLTLWYMLLSYAMLAFFTVAVIAAYSQTFEVVYHAIQEQGKGIVFNAALQHEVARFEQNFIQRLLLFDLIIALAAGLASYILSGRTLRPIQRTMEEQQKFAADASHELRTPLANITMEIAAYRQTKKPTGPQQELLNSIETEAQRMTGIVAGLLSLIRVNQQDGPKRPVNLDQLIQSVIRDMQARIDQAKLTIIYQSAGDLQIMGHQDELRQLLLILLENALLYSYPKTQIKVATDQQQQKVRLTINNQGEVIPDKELSKIFQRFYRGQGVTKPGTGLGLAIASTIVERHQGTIAVASNKHQGTTFRVLLPMSQAE